MKKLFIMLAMLLVSTAMVSAWHCTDTDAKQPAKASSWGDNALLGGTTAGWSASGYAPAGCTGTQGNFVCNDHCDGTTLKEYYCGTWSADGTVIYLKSYANSTQCGHEVPEFSTVAIVVAVIGALGVFAFVRRK